MKYNVCFDCIHNEICAIKEDAKAFTEAVDKIIDPNITKEELMNFDEDLIKKSEPFFTNVEIICQHKKQ